MNTSNPIEIGFLILIGLFSVFLFERIIAKAFKTFIFGLILFIALVLYGTKNFTTKKDNFSKLEFRDILDWPTLKQKLVPYEKEAVKDIKIDYKEAKKNF